jgi:hypothetical protein
MANKMYYCGCCYNDKRNNYYKKCNLEYCTSCKTKGFKHT